MVVQPGMSAEYVDEQVRQHRFVGFKPYMWHAQVPNWREARITDFLPEHQIEVANQYGLVMALHLSRRGGGGDAENLADLERLSGRYPRVRWLLLHNARCYFDRPMERAAPRLRQMPGVWIECSTVCEADALFTTFTQWGTERFCYGSDDFYAGVSRGKYISWGEAWTQFDDSNFTQKLQHCDDRKTFVRYEMLRALKRAVKYAGLKRSQVEDIFFGNSARLVEAVKSDLTRVLGQSNRG
jgi:glutamate-1-semialdehyde 2,1-aminomutase